MTLAQDITAAVRAVVPDGAPLHAPEIRGNEWLYVKECLDTEWVSTVGAYVERFEGMLCDITGARHAIAVVNGTSGLHVSLLLAGVIPGDEVIIPALTFIATANAVAYCGATPHFADVEQDTLGLDPAKLDAHLSDIGEIRDGVLTNKNTGRPIRAVVCMHSFGHPCDLDGLDAVCQRHGVPLVEDAAESLGSFYKDRHTGNRGLLSAISFNGNKIVTTGGGGAILTNDSDLATAAKHLTTTAKQPHRWEFVHDQIGFNYRMPNVNAAIGCAQLERLDDFVDRKRTLAARYAQAFANVPGVRFMSEPAACRSNYWLNVILLDDARLQTRDSVLGSLNEAGLMSRPVWTPMNRLAMFAQAPAMDLGVTNNLFKRLINIPSSPRLAEAQGTVPGSQEEHAL